MMSKKLSGAQRRKLAREEEATTEVPNLTSYFPPSPLAANFETRPYLCEYTQ